jgi:hypothetical protein
MSPIIQPAAPDRILIRLTEAEMGDPFPVIEDLCEEYTIGQTRASLWNLVQTALMEDGIYNNSQKRTGLLEWYHKLEKALEAAYLLVTIQHHKSESPLPT